MRRKGVVGAFWGGGKLHVHVVVKRPLAELSARERIADRLDGMRTCVVQVGEPTGQLFTCRDWVRPQGEQRVSTVTSLVHEGEEWLALTCGHGTLPVVGGNLETDFAGAPIAMDVTDVSSGDRVDGALREGHVSGTRDWAVLSVAMPEQPTDLTHPATGTYRPPLRADDVAEGEPLHHFSVLDRSRRDGVLVRYGHTRLKLIDGNSYVYTHVLHVRGDNGAFSRSGDSGSLVADDDNRVVGVVVGGSDDFDPVSYVLPLADEHGVVPASVRRFFT